MSVELLETYRKRLDDLTISHVWQGYGCTIFLELGKLTKQKENQNNPNGEYTIMIETDWRIEKGLKILVGSSSEDNEIGDILKIVKGQKITSINTVGGIPELEVLFSNSVILKTLMTFSNDPGWSIMDNAEQRTPTLIVLNGKLAAE